MKIKVIIIFIGMLLLFNLLVIAQVECPADCICDDMGNTIECRAVEEPIEGPAFGGVEEIIIDQIVAEEPQFEEALLEEPLTEEPPFEEPLADAPLEDVAAAQEDVAPVPEEPEEKPPVCENGCSLDGTCYTIGFRMLGQYCSAQGGFAEQLESNSLCDNSFECKSNLCIDGECISGGLFKRIMNWFRNLFG